MKLFFLSSSSASNKNRRNKKPNRKPSISHTDPPSFSSSASSDPSATPTTVLHLHRNAYCKFTREELESVLRLLDGGKEGGEEVSELLAKADVDGDGRISLEDFLKEEEEEEEEEELRVAFGVYDVNGDGKISAEELHAVMRMLGDDQCRIGDCRRMIRSVDSDGDGFVCFGDFVRMMSMSVGCSSSSSSTSSKLCF